MNPNESRHTTPLDPTASNTPEVPGYTLGELIGRGGMGDVYRARDLELDRDVAVKILQQRYAVDSPTASRFVEEARVTAQLQHPSIPAIYRVSKFTDGRPFLAMKLIKGETLDELLKTNAPLNHLAVIEAIARALGYAHAHDVIHRDIKPANVMIGAFGEVQMMDWGLSKVILRGGSNIDGTPSDPEATTAPTEVRSQRDSSSFTQAGSVLGTPAYMPPEQAGGEIERVGKASDVFGLGALWCKMLTGLPPFSGGDAESIRRNAMRGKTEEAFARLDGCAAEPEVVAMVKQCLAFEPGDRPPDANAVAERVAALRTAAEDRAKQAEMSRARAEVQATEERKRRRVVLVSAVAGLILLVVAGLAGWGLWRQQELRQAESDRQAAARRHEVEAALAKAAELQRRSRWSELRLTLSQTRTRLGDDGPEDLRQRLDSAQADLNLVERLESIRLLRMASGSFSQANFTSIKVTDTEYAAALEQAEIAHVGEDPATVAQRLQNSAIKDQLIAAFDDWAATTQIESTRSWLLDVTRRADPDELRVRLRDPKLWHNHAELQERLEKLKPGDIPPIFMAALGQRLIEEKGLAVPLLKAAHLQHPDDVFLAVTVAIGCAVAKRWDDAVSYYRVAQGLRPEDADICLGLALMLQFKGELDEAIAHYRRAKELRPVSAFISRMLGLALQARGLADEALVEYRRACDLEPIFFVEPFRADGTPTDRATMEKAIESFHQANEAFLNKLPQNPILALPGQSLIPHNRVERARMLIRISPRVVNWHVDLANALRAEGRADEAIAELRTAIELVPKYAPAHATLAFMLHGRKQWDEAILEYRKAIELEPSNPGTWHNLSLALRAKGLLDENLRECRRAVEAHPNDAELRHDLALALFRLGQLTEAIAELRRSSELNPRDSKAPSNLCLALLQLDRIEEALESGRKAIENNPKDALAHNILGVALRKKGSLDEGEREFRQAIEIDPRFAEAHRNLGRLLLARQRFADARDASQMALDLWPAESAERKETLRQRDACVRLLALEAKLPALLKREEPASTQDQLALAELCQARNELVAAVAFWTEAFAAEPELVRDPRTGLRYTAAYSAALASSGRGSDAVGLDEKEYARLRKKSLDWLQSDLAYWSRQATSADAKVRAEVQRTLKHWQTNRDFVGVRDKELLAKLTQAERDAWTKLWNEVAAALKSAADGKPPQEQGEKQP